MTKTEELYVNFRLIDFDDYTSDVSDQLEDGRNGDNFLKCTYSSGRYIFLQVSMVDDPCVGAEQFKKKMKHKNFHSVVNAILLKQNVDDMV